MDSRHDGLISRVSRCRLKNSDLPKSKSQRTIPYSQKKNWVQNWIARWRQEAEMTRFEAKWGDYLGGNPGGAVPCSLVPVWGDGSGPQECRGLKWMSEWQRRESEGGGRFKPRNAQQSWKIHSQECWKVAIAFPPGCADCIKSIQSNQSGMSKKYRMQNLRSRKGSILKYQRGHKF